MAQYQGSRTWTQLRLGNGQGPVDTTGLSSCGQLDIHGLTTVGIQRLRRRRPAGTEERVTGRAMGVPQSNDAVINKFRTSASISDEEALDFAGLLLAGTANRAASSSWKKSSK